MRFALAFRIQINLRSIKVVDQLPHRAKMHAKVILVARLSATLMALQLLWVLYHGVLNVTKKVSQVSTATSFISTIGFKII